jgi:hypothetical protein
VIDEESVERACEWMVSNATAAAQARANREYCDQFRKTLKAQLMREYSTLPLGAQEREAYADPRYVEHLAALKVAIENDERMRWLMTAAETKVSAFQTMSRMRRIV